MSRPGLVSALPVAHPALRATEVNSFRLIRSVSQSAEAWQSKAFHVLASLGNTFPWILVTANSEDSCHLSFVRYS